LKNALIYESIDRVRRKLNRRILAGVVLRHAPIVIACAGTLVFLWRFLCSLDLLPGASLFSRGYAFFVFLAFLIISLFAIAAFNRKRLLAREEAAIWLDERLDAKGIFSAALECLSGGRSDAFSDQILADALQACKVMLPSQKKLFPRRIIIRRSLVALAALVCMLALISVWNPRSAELAKVASAHEKIISPRGMDKEKDKDKKTEEKKSNADLARNLFPEDKRLASLAEEALKNDDQAALNYLMKENGLKAEDLKSPSAMNGKASKTGGANNPLSSPQGAENAKSQQDAQSQQNAQGQQSPQGSAENKKEGGADSNPEQGKQSENKNQNDAKSAPEGKDANAKSDPNGNHMGGKEDMAPVSGEGQGNSEKNKAGKSGQAGQGDEAGSGTADKKTGIAKKTIAAGSENMIKFRKEATPLEFVLPDKNAKETMAQTLPSALRGTEAAIGGDTAPLDYESFVNSYFSTLSKEMQQ